MVLLDDTQALQAALNTAAKGTPEAPPVFLPAGTYRTHGYVEP